MRFRKSIKIMPGVRLNLSKSGVSTSVGGRGGTVNISKRGVRSTVSIPGTGLSWSSNSGWADGGRSRPANEVDHLLREASNTIKKIGKEADKANAVGGRIDRAISNLNSGRGVTASKVQTFEKRVLNEEDKLFDMEAKVREERLFLQAIEERLRSLKFGFFSGSAKRERDEVLSIVAGCAAEARSIEGDLADGHRALSAKLTEVHELLASKS